MSRGLLESARALEWKVGEEYQIVTISFDPRDDAKKAAFFRADMMDRYGRELPAGVWPYLTGVEEQIRRVAKSVAFEYEWNEEIQQYGHPATIYVLTPGGKLSRYYEGFRFSASELKFSLMDAADGKVGTFWDRISRYCVGWDPEVGKYVPIAWRAMQIGGGLTILVLLLVIMLARRSRTGALAGEKATEGRTNEGRERDTPPGVPIGTTPP